MKGTINTSVHELSVLKVYLFPLSKINVERRRGWVVRAARLWCRKSPYCVSSRLGCAMRRLENSTQQKMGTFFELRKDKAAKGEGWAPPFISCAQDTVGL